MLRCVSLTPLGSPVVPLEYGSETTSVAGSISTGSGSPAVDHESVSASAPSPPSNEITVSTPAEDAAASARSSSALTVKSARAPALRSCCAISPSV